MELEYTDRNQKHELNYYHQLRQPMATSFVPTVHQPSRPLIQNRDLLREIPFLRPAKKYRKSNEWTPCSTVTSKHSQQDTSLSTRHISLTIKARPWWKSHPKQIVTSMDKDESDHASNRSQSTKACFLYQRRTPSSYAQASPSPQQEPIASKSSSTQRQNSLLSYFKTTNSKNKSAHSTKNLNHSNNEKTCTERIEKSKNTTILNLNPCSFCDHIVCGECIHKCASCAKDYCTFCSISSYENERDVQFYCLDCADSNVQTQTIRRKDSVLYMNDDLDDMMIG